MEAVLDSQGQRRLKSLVLIYLFVVGAAEDCPKPQGGENMILSPQALLMNEFPAGSSVTLVCANGYVRDSGSGNINCIDQRWTEPDLICKKQDCGPPRKQPNMNFNITDGTLFAAVIKVYCDRGYRIVGSSYKQCFPFGWSGKASCEIVKCRQPPGITNGSMSWDSETHPKYGDIIVYSCDEGFSPVGEFSVMCMDTGLYNSSAPKCNGVTTQGSIATEMPISVSASPAQETSAPAAPSATLTALRDKTAAASTTVSPSQQAGDRVTTARVTTTLASPRGMHDVVVHTRTDTGPAPFIFGVIATVLFACIAVVIVIKMLKRRKGSMNGVAPISQSAIEEGLATKL